MLLGIETTATELSASLWATPGVAGHEHRTGRRRHVESLAPAINHVCRRPAVRSASSMRRVDVGPGLFTGCDRRGDGEGAAQGLGIGAIGVTSLERWPMAPSTAAPGSVLAVVDARRSEVFVAPSRLDPWTLPRWSSRALSLRARRARPLLEAAPGEGGPTCLCVGDGARPTPPTSLR